MDFEMAVRILNSRQVISVAGKYACKVTRVGNALSSDNRNLFITDTNLMTSAQVVKAEELLAEGKFDEACNQKLSFISQYAPSYQPQKGELVNATVEQVEDALYVRGFSAVPVAATQKHTFGSAVVESAQVEQASSAVKGVKVK